MFLFTYSLLPKLLLMLALCSSAVAAISWQKRTDDRKDVILTEENNGQTVDVETEGTIVVRLKSQMGTGYGWQISKADDKRVKLVGEPELENAEDRKSGGVEHQVFRFKAISRGTSELELVYIRPWEKTAKPSKTFRLKVRVQ